MCKKRGRKAWRMGGVKKYLLDTSFLIDLMKRHQKALSTHNIIKGKESTSVICAYELSKYSESAALAILKKDTIPFDKTDASEAASIFRKLRSDGEMIPEMDIMIAGTAINRRLTLVTRDEHFKRIKELDTEFY